MRTPRWQRKWERDHLTDGWSPIPTQIVSNEEYLPASPTREPQRVAARLRETSRRHAAGLGLTRRQFLASPCGMAAAFLAMNAVFGRFFDVDPAEAWEPPRRRAHGRASRSTAGCSTAADQLWVSQ